mgnify:CR=1 FL=1
MKVYILYQTDVWKTYGSRVCFGVYSSDKLAREYAAKEKLKKEGSSEYIVKEAELDKFEEVL